MNELTYAGLVLGVLAVVLYAAMAFRRGRATSLDLVDAALILFSTVGATGAIRLAGFVFLGDFARTVKLAPPDLWSLSADDGVFVVIGGMCLLWVSCQGIRQGFRNLDAPLADAA